MLKSIYVKKKKKEKKRKEKLDTQLVILRTLLAIQICLYFVSYCLHRFYIHSLNNIELTVCGALHKNTTRRQLETECLMATP